MPSRNTVVIELTAGKMPNGRLYAYAEPERATAREGDTIKWIIDAHDGVKGVRPDHFRLKATWSEPRPFVIGRPKLDIRERSYSARTSESGVTRVYKYDIMVGDTVVDDPEIQIRE